MAAGLRDRRRSGIPKLKKIIDIWANIAMSTLVQTPMAIQNVFSTPTVIRALVENGARLENRKKVAPQKYNVHHFLFVLL